MRRLASRFLLVGLVIAVIAVVIVRADGSGGDLVSMKSLGAERQPSFESFRVDDAMRVAIEAGGSFESGGADTVLAAQGWLVHRETGRVVWRMRPATRPARGTFVLMRDTLVLQPGVYDAVYATLGDPLVRVTEASGDGIGDRLNNFLSQGGRGWVGDTDRWRFYVRPASDTERGKGVSLGREIPEDADGLIWSSGSARSSELYEVSLRATEPVRVQLDALFEATDGVVADSAYLVSASGDTLWAAKAEGSRWAGGSIKNRRQTGTINLPAGIYRAGFRTDRDHAWDSWTANPPWEPWRWGLRISPADSASARGAIKPLDPMRDFPRIAEILCVGESASEEVRFEIVEPMEIIIAATGEIVSGTGYDYATLEREGQGGTVWDLREASLQSAGGASKNQRAEETLSLAPGAYTLRYVTDGSHHCGSFNSEAPEPDDFWGAIIVAADGEPVEGRVRSLEALASAVGPPEALAPASILASLVRVESGRDVSGQFQLSDSTDVCVLGLGEITPNGRYDWGSISSSGGGTVWEMTRGNTSPAGGDDGNRRAIDKLRLAPGTYTARYITDGSHAWGDWDNGRPDRPDDWGVQVWRVPTGFEDEPMACVATVMASE